jgi:hypothetical protein
MTVPWQDVVDELCLPGVEVTAAGPRDRLIQQIAFEVEDRDAFLKALAHLHSKGVKPINGPLIHGFEGGGHLGGRGSRLSTSSIPTATAWRCSGI